MIKTIIKYTLLLLTSYSCNQDTKNAKFAGVWVDKSLMEGKGIQENLDADSIARFPLIMFEKEMSDSVLFYYSTLKRNMYPAHYAYESYFIHFDKDNEYFLVMDYKTDEMVFSNLKGDNFERFVKVDTMLSKADLFGAAFDINRFIRSVR